MSNTNKNTWALIIALILIVGIVLAVLAIFLGFGNGISCLGWSKGSGMMGGMMMFGWIFMLIPVGFVIFILYLLFNRDKEPQQQPQNARNITLEMLDQRYASGEISRKEYLRMKKDILTDH